MLQDTDPGCWEMGSTFADARVSVKPPPLFHEPSPILMVSSPTPPVQKQRVKAKSLSTRTSYLQPCG